MRRIMGLLLLLVMLVGAAAMTGARRVNALPEGGRESEREGRAKLDPVYGKIDPFGYGFDLDELTLTRTIDLEDDQVARADQKDSRVGRRGADATAESRNI